MINKIVSRFTAPRIRPEDLTFEQARDILDRASEEAKQRLAELSGEPEILAYLSKDLKGEIRALVAGNEATPRDIDLDLADDELGEVRIELARKIARLLPGLSDKEADRIRDTTIKVIEKLASDSLPRVRQIVAEEIKSSAEMPREIAQSLARDAEIAVSAPILEYSPMLSDDDLLEIIATSEVEGVLTAIAKRSGLSSDVSEAVVATLDIPAVTALLANASAEIRAETLDRIVDHARHVEAWHRPLVLRPELSIRAIRRISGFVASSLLDMLSERHHLDDETRLQISARVRERLRNDESPSAEGDPKQRLWGDVSAALNAGILDDDYVLDAIKGKDFLRVSLSLVALARAPESTIERVLKSGSAQMITALAWRANLQMRTAFAIQKNVAKLPPGNLLPARNGVDYPLSPQQMKDQLDLLGLQTES